MAHLGGVVFLISILISLINAEIRCLKNERLAVDFEDVEQLGYTFSKAYVNKSIPASITYKLISKEPIDQISWVHNNVSVKIDDNKRQEVYYSITNEDYGYEITLHIKMPTARVTGIWTLTVITGDQAEHVAQCAISSKPVIRSRFGAVRGHENNPLSVLCEVDGYPNPNLVEWKRVERGDEHSASRLVPVTDASFKPYGETKNAIMEWNDASAATGFYLCKAISTLGLDSQIIEVRIKSKLAPLWPFIGILVQIFVLGIIILIYERAQSKRRKNEERATLLKSTTQTNQPSPKC